MMKKLIFISLLISGIQTKAMDGWFSTAASYCTPKIMAGLSILASAVTLKWFRTPDTKDYKFEDLNVRTIRTAQANENTLKVDDVKKFLWQKTKEKINFQPKEEKQAYEIANDIELTSKDDKVTIAVGGFLHKIAFRNCSNGAPSGHAFLRDAIIEGPCITYDNVNDTRAGYSFGGKQDIDNLNSVIKAVVKKNPDISITIIANCKGGTVTHNCLAKAEENGETYLKNIKGVIFDSTPISLDHTIRNQPLYCISHYFYRLIFPNYDYKAPTILDAKKYPKDIPILIGEVKDDVTAPHEDVDKIQQKLSDLGNTKIERYIREKSTKDIIHGRLTTKDPKFQEVCRRFIQEAHTKAPSEVKKTMEKL